jgi:beta-lactamase class A
MKGIKAMFKFFGSTVPYYVFLVTAICCLFLGYLAGESAPFTDAPTNTPVTDSAVKKSLGTCTYSLPRLKGYNFVKPLLFSEPECESDEHIALKEQINELIKGYQSAGKLKSASVYFRNLEDEGWICINGDEKFEPASLYKVPVLMTVLRISESTPGYLERKLTFSEPINIKDRVQTFHEKGIEMGKTYTLRELLYNMITYSDNNAAVMLFNYISVAEFNKTLTDLGIEPLKSGEVYHPLTVKGYANFFKVLFDAGYLTIHDSEYALSLLSQSTFKNGILAGVPGNIKVAHKFGEGSGTNANGHELHEAGIVYYDDHPYLLTVMTSGADFNTLTEIIGNISKVTYIHQANTYNGGV